MKLKLVGIEEKYTVEQNLLTILPGELPIYGEIDSIRDTRWAMLRLSEEDGMVVAETQLSYDGKTGEFRYSYPLSGDAYTREGQRRHAIGMSFFHAAREALGITPAWGSLTGVRPGKVALPLLKERGADEAEHILQEAYFVTPERAHLVVETAEKTMQAAEVLSPQDISLYVGIPFCPTRCSYCSFVSQSVEKSFSLIEPYLEVLFAEIKSAGAMVRELGLHIKSFYMGGGTPTSLTAEQMDRLLVCLEKHFDWDDFPEITVEAGRPDTIQPEKLAVLRRHGVTRLSVNPQSMEDRVLQAIGRRHSAEDVRRAVDMVKQAGFSHWNMDLIAGLPEDCAENFARSLEEVLSFGADNITIHTLSLKKGSRILLEGSRIPLAEEVGTMLDYADKTLRNHGFTPYYLYRQKYMSGSFENVGWSYPGAECLYNIYIMEELHGILSLGAGASTKMRNGDTIRRVFNAKYPKEYIERPEKWKKNLEAFASFYENMSFVHSS